MVDWQATATTIYCDAVDDDVTIIVYKDWSTRCTGYKKYHESVNTETMKILKKKSKLLGKNIECLGPLDYRVTGYRDKLIAQDKNTSVPMSIIEKK